LRRPRKTYSSSRRIYEGPPVLGALRPHEDSGGYDIVSRFFAPWLGIDEAPVTGSLHTILTLYWCGKFGKKELLAFQASERSGEIALTMDDERVYVTGEDVTLVKGTLRDPA